MRLSELQHKDIIDLNGNKVGNIIDVILDQNGNLISFVIEEHKGIFKFGVKDTNKEISFDKIQKIGEDVILVKIENN